MLQTQVEPRAAGEWFYCQFYNNMEKLQEELALFSTEKTYALLLM